MKPFPEISSHLISSHVTKPYIQLVHQINFLLLSVVALAGVKAPHLVFSA